MEDAIAEEPTEPTEDSIDARDVTRKRIEILGEEIQAAPRLIRGAYSDEALKKVVHAHLVGRIGGLSQLEIVQALGVSSATLALARNRFSKEFKPRKPRTMSNDEATSTSFFKLLPKAQEEQVREKPKTENRIRFIEVVTSDEKTLEAAIAKFLKE